MRKVLIGEIGAIVKLGLRELIDGDDGCEIVAEPTDTEAILTDLEAAAPDVVLLDLDEGPTARLLARTITTTHPAVKVIACSSVEPRMRIFPPNHHGESYIARMSPEMLMEAVKEN